MSNPALWYLLIGGLLLAMLLGNSFIERLPLTPAMLYLGVGVLLGPAALGWLRFDAFRDAGLLERAAEVAVLISLFTSGLKLRLPLSDVRWRLPVLLATVSMAITIGLVALVGSALLHLSLGAAILLGAILAPTDPVLASVVQVREPHDRDRLRFALLLAFGHAQVGHRHPLLRSVERLHFLDHRHLAVEHGEMRADDVEEAL